MWLEPAPLSIAGDFRPFVYLIVPVAGVVSLVLRDRSDRQRIIEDAEVNGRDVISVHWRWMPFSSGPFSWYERLIPGCRLFRVRAYDKGGRKRVADVLIGPRRFVSRWQSQEDRVYGTLTWRWADKRP